MKSLLSFGDSIFNHAQLIIVCENATSVTAKKSSTTVSANEANGKFYFFNLAAGTWTITATNGTNTVSKTVSVTSSTSMEIIYMHFIIVPIFTYSGTYEIVDDNNNVVNNEYQGNNWKIKFLTSGTLKFSNLGSITTGIDVFLVGGGGGGGGMMGGGGGGGYTKTVKNKSVNIRSSYSITIGSGGAGGDGSSWNTGINGKDGGLTTGFGFRASGGKGGINGTDSGGGDGGSGGKGGDDDPGIGFTDGEPNGGWNGNGNNGYGQKYKTGPNGETGSTREFEESTGILYSYGGKVGCSANDIVGYPLSNSGNGGSGSITNVDGYSGASGIIIIRNTHS